MFNIISVTVYDDNGNKIKDFFKDPRDDDKEHRLYFGNNLTSLYEKFVIAFEKYPVFSTDAVAMSKAFRYCNPKYKECFTNIARLFVEVDLDECLITIDVPRTKQGRFTFHINFNV